jgi:tetratricopeptide (TPR) repeat protein
LKPANVMVGAYGEVLIVDWGLAKLLGEEQPEEEEGRPATRRPASGSASVTGAVRGTLAYRPPEQARGRVHEVDERSDVFALGAMLCEILTGRPPYTGETSDPLFEAAEGQLDAAMERLATCGADDDLVALAAQCLAPDPGDRPRGASLVAQAVGDHLAALEERAREAEIKAAEERSQAKIARARERQVRQRAEWERRRRRRVPVFAAVVLLTVGLGIGGYVVKAREDHAQAEQTRAAVAEAMRKAIPLEAAGQWEAALKWADKAVAHARAGQADTTILDRALALRARVEERAEKAAAAARLAEDDERLLSALEHMLGWNPEQHDRRKAAVFRAHGIDLESLSIPEAVAVIRKRSRPAELAMALDSWVSLRRDRPTTLNWKRLDEIARAVDPDPWRNELRDAVVANDIERLRALAHTADLASLTPPTVRRLAYALRDGGDNSAAEVLARTAHRCRPGDPTLGRILMSVRPREAVRFLQATAAANLHGSVPWSALGGILRKHMRDNDGAIRAFRAAIRLDPFHAHHYSNLGNALKGKRNFAAAIKAYRKALELDSSDAIAWLGLGWALECEGDVEGALAAFRKAIQLDPDDVRGHIGRSGVLRSDPVRDYEGAIEACRAAIDIDPDDPSCHVALGHALSLKGDNTSAIEAYRKALDVDPEYAPAWASLASALGREGEVEAALAASRKAIELDPDDPCTHCSLGVILCDRLRDYDGAIREFREAIRLDPFIVHHYFNLGNALKGKRNFAAAIKAYRKAVELAPEDPACHYGLGEFLLHDMHDPEGAIPEYRKAIDLDPDYARAWSCLGRALCDKGELERALAACRKATQLAPNDSRVRVNLGVLLCDHVRDYDGAIREFREAIRLDDENAVFHFNLANALDKKGRFSSALKAYRNAVALDPGHATGWSRLGWLLGRKGDLEGALTACRKAVDLEPNAAEHHWRLGVVLRDQGHDYEAAIRELRTAAKLAPNDPSTHSDLGLALYRAGRFEDAIGALKDAVRLSGGRYVRDKRLLGRALYRAGRFEDAIRTFDELMRQARGGEAGDWLFMAMAQAKAGHPEDARAWYRKAAAWLEERPWETRQVADLLAEAKALLAEVGRD